MSTASPLDEAISLAQKWSQPHFWNCLFKFRNELQQAKQQRQKAGESLSRHVRGTERVVATSDGRLVTSYHRTPAHDFIETDGPAGERICWETFLRDQLMDAKNLCNTLDPELNKFDDHTRLLELVLSNWPALIGRIPFPPQLGAGPTEGYTVPTLAAMVRQVYGELLAMTPPQAIKRDLGSKTSGSTEDGPYELGRFRLRGGKVVVIRGPVQWWVLKSLWGKGQRDGRCVWREVTNATRVPGKTATPYSRGLFLKHCRALQDEIQPTYPQIEIGPVLQGSDLWSAEEQRPLS